MAFMKKIWKNKDVATVDDPRIDADNLNRIEDGIQEAIDDAVAAKVTVVDSLISTSTTSALSANQGKILNDNLNDGLDKQFIMLGRASNNQYGATNPKTILPGMNKTIIKLGTAFNSVSGSTQPSKITIGSDMSIVKVNVHAFFTSLNVSGQVSIALCKNGIVIPETETFDRKYSIEHRTCIINDFFVSVSQNDTLEVYIGSDMTSTADVRSWWSVEKVI